MWVSLFSLQWVDNISTVLKYRTRFSFHYHLNMPNAQLTTFGLHPSPVLSSPPLPCSLLPSPATPSNLPPLPPSHTWTKVRDQLLFSEHTTDGHLSTTAIPVTTTFHINQCSVLLYIFNLSTMVTLQQLVLSVPKDDYCRVLYNHTSVRSLIHTTIEK